VQAASHKDDAASAPVLPPTWKLLTLRHISFRGKHYDITVARGADGRPVLTSLPE
jgi:protein-glucosylgalactosylhydroxylysine glucosidase